MANREYKSLLLIIKIDSEIALRKIYSGYLLDKLCRAVASLVAHFGEVRDASYVVSSGAHGNTVVGG